MKSPKKQAPLATPATIRLNKYIANAGICSRRKADEYIANGQVKVNGEVVTEMGHRVTLKDEVRFKDKVVTPEKKVYVLLNKPKDYITTASDPQNRKKVMDLVKDASKERLYPVGRLDRKTTGLLLLTNDGELAQQLSHPSHKVQKIYHVVLDKPVTKNDLMRIASGLELKDGIAEVDQIAYADPQDKSHVGIELHIGKNRIVRRIFEKSGYKVKTLDRVLYAGLTKKKLSRGKWRHLSEKEVRSLKFFLT